MEIRDTLAVLFRRRWLIAAVVAASLAAGSLYNALHVPLYRASVLVELNSGSANLTAYQGAYQSLYYTPQWQNTQLEILRGRALSERVVLDGLPPELEGELRLGPVLPGWQLVLGGARRLGSGVVPNPVPAASAAGIQFFSAILQSRLSVEGAAPGSQLVTVSAAGFSPDGVAAAANAIAEAYVQHVRRTSLERAGGAQGWLSERVGEQRSNLSDSARTLREYEQSEGLLNLEERRALAGQRLATLGQQLAQAKARVRTLETLRDRLADSGRLADPAAVRQAPALAAARAELEKRQAELARLGRDLGERHPAILKARADVAEAEERLQAAAREFRSGSEVDLEDARAEVQTLEADLRQLNQEVATLKEKSVRFDVLKREADATNQVLGSLTLRAKEAGLEGEVSAPTVRILEKAQPPGAPYAPDGRANVQTALLAGLAACLLVVIFLENANATLARPEELRELGLAVLGTIPDVPPAKGMTIVNSPAAAEAYRVLRTSLGLRLPAAASRVVLVSSARPGEGKSTTAASLALALARNGARVLLIDGDLRRPSQSRRFEVAAAPGLADVLAGTPALEEAVRTLGEPGLALLTAGGVTASPAELLGSPRLATLLAEARLRWEWILVDSPPLLAVTDTAVLATHADASVLVAVAHGTPRAAFLEALEVLRSTRAAPAGVVLNRIHQRFHSYYYGYDYGEYQRRHAG